ncbi:MAG: hypothetical protein ACK4K4_04255 [Caldimicrobium sp.]
MFTNIEPKKIPKHIEKFIRHRFQQALGFEKIPVRVLLRLRE